jgi:hypothetical protein
MLRLTTRGAFDPAAASEGLKSALARAAEVERFAAVPDRIEAASAKVRGHFELLIGKGKK